MDRTRALRLLLLIAGLGVALVLSRRWPSDHTFHVVLGDAAPRVRDLRVRYAEVGVHSAADDWEREVRFHYDHGRAPRVVEHRPRVVTGDYDVEIDVEVADDHGAPRAVSTSRHVRLDDGTASVDVSGVVRDSLGELAVSPAPPAAVAEVPGPAASASASPKP